MNSETVLVLIKVFLIVLIMFRDEWNVAQYELLALRTNIIVEFLPNKIYLGDIFFTICKFVD
jgi:hypothetical protein